MQLAVSANAQSRPHLEGRRRARNESDHPFRRPGLAPRPPRRRPAQVPDRLQRANPARPAARYARGERSCARRSSSPASTTSSSTRRSRQRSGGPSVRTIYNPFYKVADNTGSLFMAREELAGDCLVWNGDTLVSTRADAAGRRQPTGRASASRSTARTRYDEDDMKVVDGGRAAARHRQANREGVNAEVDRAARVPLGRRRAVPRGDRAGDAYQRRDDHLVPARHPSSGTKRRGLDARHPG